MDGIDFVEIRRYLEKTQVQMARLLGVSLKAVQSFEQGWRSVPAHIERQMLFLLYLKRVPPVGIGPCWDRRNCLPEMREECVAWEMQAGQLCWFVNGTVCEGRAQESWEEKMRLCRQCEVFRTLIPTSAWTNSAEPAQKDHIQGLGDRVAGSSNGS